ncbi:MAG: glutathione S-transferase N-terminal domain-containing protein [Deltaproteobacteria bacterium]|nr:glutathione S-transferase N-terminal domain-containing protein [Deltaproteobacteria bacterium]
MKLCYMPGSCALAPHIALHWIGRPFEIWKIDRELLQDPQYLKINPLGKVPALIEDDGATLTECGAILTYLAEKFPEARLGPGEGIRARYEMNRWISHLGGNVHPAFYPFFLTARYHPDPAQHPAVQEQAQAQIYKQMDLMERQMAGRDWVLEGRKTVVDAYLFALFRWNKRLPRPMTEYPNLLGWYRKMGEDAGVARALAEQGLEL